MHKPHYISVSAPLTYEDVKSIVKGSQEAGLDTPSSSHKGAAGFCVDAGTVQGRTPASPRKVTDRNTLVELTTVAKEGGVVPTIHFDIQDRSKESPKGTRIEELVHFYTQQWTSDVATLLSDLDGICKTLQLNGIPTLDTAKRWRDENPDTKLIYPIQREMVKASDLLPHLVELHEAIGIDTFSFDPSGGAGEAFTTNDAAAMYKLLTENFPGVRISLAGGFSETNVFRRVIDIRQAIGTNCFGIDAEGQLRDKPSDNLNHSKVAAFMKNGAAALQ